MRQNLRQTRLSCRMKWQLRSIACYLPASSIRLAQQLSVTHKQGVCGTVRTRHKESRERFKFSCYENWTEKQTLVPSGSRTQDLPTPAYQAPGSAILRTWYFDRMLWPLSCRETCKTCTCVKYKNTECRTTNTVLIQFSALLPTSTPFLISAPS